MSRLRALTRDVLRAKKLLSPLLLGRANPRSCRILTKSLRCCTTIHTGRVSPHGNRVIGTFIVPPGRRGTTITRMSLLDPTPRPVTAPRTPATPTNSASLHVAGLRSHLSRTVHSLGRSRSHSLGHLRRAIGSLGSRVPRQIRPLSTFGALDLPRLTRGLTSTGIHNGATRQVLGDVRGRHGGNRFGSFASVIRQVSNLNSGQVLTVVSA